MIVNLINPIEYFTQQLSDYEQQNIQIRTQIAILFRQFMYNTTDY